MKTVEEIEALWEKEKHLWNPHHQNVVAGRIKRAIYEGIQVVLDEDEFHDLDEKERQDWACIPFNEFFYWARGPICGPVTDLDGIETEEY